MLFYLPFLLLLYIVLTGILYIAWKKIPFYTSSGKAPATRLSVLIAVRNEERGIEKLLQDLEKQTYPKDLFEVLILDDHSEDATANLVRAFREKTTLDLKLIQLPQGITGKKNAIAEGIRNATGTLIVTTDGDCRVKPRWLELFEGFYREKKVKMITGGVSFFESRNIREKMLTLEFASLVGSGASTLSMGYPSMCNGANLAYEKQAFTDVNGYQDSAGLPSGDDEFLMHKLYKQYPGQVAFIKNPETVVETEAPASWKLFYNQRRRWASKWENYTYTHVKVLALLIFGSNLALVINFFLCGMSSYPLGIFLLLLTFKFMLEFLFLRSVLVYFGRKIDLLIFLITELIYPFYVVFFALAGRSGQYKWKDRQITKK